MIACWRRHGCARAVDPFVKDTKNNTRSFAGRNILCSGDFWQLPPPDGGFLGDIPSDFIQASRQYFPVRTTAHGQSLLWSEAPTGMTGVAESQQCDLTK